MTTMWSIGSPSNYTSATPKYTSGASRRLSATSRWQSSKRASLMPEIEEPELNVLSELVHTIIDEQQDRHVCLDNAASADPSPTVHDNSREGGTLVRSTRLELILQPGHGD